MKLVRVVDVPIVDESRAEVIALMSSHKDVIVTKDALIAELEAKVARASEEVDCLTTTRQALTLTVLSLEARLVEEKTIAEQKALEAEAVDARHDDQLDQIAQEGAALEYKSKQREDAQEEGLRLLILERERMTAEIAEVRESFVLEKEAALEAVQREHDASIALIAETNASALADKDAALRASFEAEANALRLSHADELGRHREDLNDLRRAHVYAIESARNDAERRLAETGTKLQKAAEGRAQAESFALQTLIMKGKKTEEQGEVFFNDPYFTQHLSPSTKAHHFGTSAA